MPLVEGARCGWCRPASMCGPGACPCFDSKSVSAARIRAGVVASTRVSSACRSSRLREGPSLALGGGAQCSISRRSRSRHSRSLALALTSTPPPPNSFFRRVHSSASAWRRVVGVGTRISATCGVRTHDRPVSSRPGSCTSVCSHMEVWADRGEIGGDRTARMSSTISWSPLSARPRPIAKSRRAAAMSFGAASSMSESSATHSASVGSGYEPLGRWRRISSARAESSCGGKARSCAAHGARYQRCLSSALEGRCTVWGVHCVWAWRALLARPAGPLRGPSSGRP